MTIRHTTIAISISIILVGAHAAGGTEQADEIRGRFLASCRIYPSLADDKAPASQISIKLRAVGIEELKAVHVLWAPFSSDGQAVRPANGSGFGIYVLWRPQPIRGNGRMAGPREYKYALTWLPELSTIPSQFKKWVQIPEDPIEAAIQRIQFYVVGRQGVYVLRFKSRGEAQQKADHKQIDLAIEPEHYRKFARVPRSTEVASFVRQWNRMKADDADDFNDTVELFTEGLKTAKSGDECWVCKGRGMYRTDAILTATIYDRWGASTATTRTRYQEFKCATCLGQGKLSTSTIALARQQLQEMKQSLFGRYAESQKDGTKGRAGTAESPSVEHRDESLSKGADSKMNPLIARRLVDADKHWAAGDDLEAYAEFKWIVERLSQGDELTRIRQIVAKYEADQAFMARFREQERRVSAAGELKMAMNYLKAGRHELAKDKLRLVVDAYPDTPSAKEASQRLKELK